MEAFKKGVPVNMDTTAEKDLVILAQRGDESAFESLIQEALPKLRTLLISQYRLQPTDVDEIVQSSMIKVWRKIESFRNESSFATWFCIILRNEAIDYVKKRSELHAKEICAHNPYLDEGSTHSADYDNLSVEQTLEETAVSIIEKKELLGLYCQMINQVFQELSPSHSQIIHMALEEEKTYKQIASELGIPIGTVMSRLFFARKEAQQLIIQYARRSSTQLPYMGQCR